MGNFVRLFCFTGTNIQAVILRGVDPTDQPMLVHIWMLCCKCHRGQGCGVCERHLLWVPQQGLLCFRGGFRWLLHRKLTHKGTQMSQWLDGVDRVDINGTKEGERQCFCFFLGWEVTPKRRATDRVSCTACWRQCRCSFPGQQPCKPPFLLGQFQLKM